MLEVVDLQKAYDTPHGPLAILTGEALSLASSDMWDQVTVPSGAGITSAPPSWAGWPTVRPWRILPPERTIRAMPVVTLLRPKTSETVPNFAPAAR